MEELYNLLLNVNPFYIYLIIFSAALVENIIPPMPSDLVVVFAGTLLTSTALSFIPTLLISTLGSLLGFILVFYFGFTLSSKIEEHKFNKYIKPEAIQKVHNLFEKYGYGVIIANRFLPGTRAIVSFCAGLAKMNFKVVSIISSISALLWNSLLLYVGYSIGSNLTAINNFFISYNKIAWIILSTIILLFMIRYFVNKYFK